MHRPARPFGSSHWSSFKAAEVAGAGVVVVVVVFGVASVTLGGLVKVPGGAGG